VSGKYLLDTNVVIALFAGEPSVHRRFDLAAHVFLPNVVIGELYYGACASGSKAANLRRIEDFAKDSEVLFCDAQTARGYGDVRYDLRQKGRPIPENDVWIAALGLQHGLIVVSRDAHFDEVSGLLREAW
jgi:tRNA(fMet)-specific endonuclease VapC